jgi:acyl-coenzyme A thioesterase PaaI-like protein
MGHRFDEDTAVTALADGRYAARLSGDWAIGGALHGGYLLAVACQAALADDPHPDLLAVSANYLRSPQPGPSEAVVERTRSGRRVGFSRVLMTQDGEPWLDAVVTSGTLTSDAPLWSEIHEDDRPTVEDCMDMSGPAPDGRTMPMGELRETRLDPRMPWVNGKVEGPPRTAAWMRLRGGRDPDPLVLAYFADALPPVTFAQGRFGWVPTVHLSLMVRARPAAGWCWAEMRGGLEVGGYLDEQVEVWDSAGRLVAQGRQLALSPRG